MVKTCIKCGQTKSWCKCRQQEYNKKYYIKNREKILNSVNQYCAENRNVVLENKRQYYIKNKNKLLEYQKQYRTKNRQKVLNDKKEYYKTPRGKLVDRAHCIKRRALKMSAKKNDLTVDDWIMIKEKYQNHCLCCGIKTDKLTMDHIVPLSKGGNHTKENIQPLCQSCNASKHTKTIDYRIRCCIITKK